jgi:hypothetical protein
MIRIEQHGLRGIERHLRGIALRAEDLRPLGYAIRDRWLESERRVFARRPWPRRAASTLRRYRYPVRRWRKGGGGPMRTGRFQGRGVGSYTGAMQRALTRPHQRGVRDTVRVGRGRLTVIVGVQARGAIAHARFFDSGAGRQPPRTVVVFDELAQRDSAADTTAYLLGEHASRRRA